jgi:hypothetical protein
VKRGFPDPDIPKRPLGVAPKCVEQGFYQGFCSAPGRTRTCDARFRNRIEPVQQVTPRDVWAVQMASSVCPVVGRLGNLRGLSISGRRQPSDPPTPADWKVLFDQVQIYAEAVPWRHWADDIDFVVDVILDGERQRVKAVVMGNAGIQPGLAIFPGEVVEAVLERRDPATPWPFEPETLACTLDDPVDVPVEFRDRAIRYGWPQTAHLVPSFFGVDEEGGREISTANARLFSVVTAAVLTHDLPLRRPSPHPNTPTEGHVAMPDSRSARYSVLHQERPG